MTIQGNTLLRASLPFVLLAATSIAGAQETDMRIVDHKDYQLQVPANWESFDSETPDGGLVQIFYDPDLKASSRQCMLESSMHKLSDEALAAESMKSPWQQKKWTEVLPHLTDATEVVMKNSSYSNNIKGQGQHVGEFTFYSAQFFWHSRSYVMHSPNRLINLTCSATSHKSPVEAEKVFQQITPMISRIADSINKIK